MHATRNRRIACLAAACATALAAACGETPMASADGPDASSTIRFDLVDRVTSAGIPICDETDLAAITFTPRGETSRSRERALDRAPDCGADFRVTVPRGRVDFGGRLVGGGRTLMRGAVPNFRAEEDGFVVRIALREVEALDVETRTIGLGGPASYTFSVEGSDLRFPIGLDDADTVAALAGGPRRVTLHPEPCTVVNGPATRDVMIPRIESRLGSTLFEVDCGAGGDVDIIIDTGGTGDPPDYTAWVEDEPYAGTRDSMRVTGVTPGPLSVEIEIGNGCTAEKVTEEPHFLPSGGRLRVEFVIRCGQSSRGGPPGGGPPGGGPGTPPISTDAIRVVTQASQPPLPGEITTFDALVTSASNVLRRQVLGVADSVTFRVAKDDYPYTVSLVPTGTCFVTTGTSSRSVTAPGSGFTRVVFDVGC